MFTTPATSSFTEFLSLAAPELLPGRRPLPPGTADIAPHATTIIAIAAAEGVVMAGDRRATMGNLIASRDIEKVHPADEYSLIGIAGTAGIGIEMIRLFQVELEHYEKIEGAVLSLDGKANRLASLIRNNLGAALQGLAVVPLFAKSALKKRYRAGLSIDEAVTLAVEALYDAADDDTATGGPDLTRRIFPVVATATAEGTRRLTDAEAAEVAEAVVARRMENPGG